MSDEAVDRGFTARTAPWMKLGTVIDRPVSTLEAIKLSGLGFTVSKRRTWYEGKDGKPKENRSRIHIVRDDTDEVMGIGSTGYGLVQFREAFAFMDEIDPYIVAAGPLKSYRQAFIVVQHPQLTKLDLMLGGEHDPIDLYAVLRTSHDLSRAVEIALMGLRDKCMNQLTLPSFTAGVPHRWSVRHVTTVHERMHEARKVIVNMGNWGAALERNAKRLAAMELTVDEARDVMHRVLPDRPKRDEAVDGILNGWKSDPTVGFYPTGWGLLQGVSSYYEWGERGSNRTPQSQLLGALEGSTHKYVRRTASALLSQAPRPQAGVEAA